MRLLLWFLHPFFHLCFLGSLVKAVAGPVIGGLFGKEGQESANSANAAEHAANREFQAEQNQKAMDFSKHMANTSYRRGMRDMRKAGLNPMLAFMKGGAPAPTGVTSAGSAARHENTMAPLASGLSGVNFASIENIEANTAKQKAEAASALAQAQETNARIPTHAANIEYTKALTSKVGPEIQKILSDSALSSVTYNKVIEEISNLIVNRDLSRAQTEEALARAGLTTAQIKEVAPRINEMVARTAHTSADVPYVQHRSSLSGMVDLPAIVNSSGSAHPIKGLDSLGSKIQELIESLNSSAKSYAHTLKERDNARKQRDSK